MDQLQFVKDNMLPFAELLGLEFTEAAPDCVVAEMLVRKELCTRPDTLHGGAIMALADTLGATATVLNLDLSKGQGTTTIESKTNFIAGAPIDTKVRAECRPIHRGRRTMVWQTTVTNEAGKTVAVVTQTQLVL